MLRRVRATHYVTPLREGGSLPGLVEADDDGIYVAKFRGAGQGTASLVAEVVVGELGRRLGVRVPELVVVDLDPRIAAREPDEEVQDLLAASAGDNLGIDFLPGSVGYDGVGWRPSPEDAAAVLWLDAFTGNVDRSWRNPNLLVWHRALWAIDHGAALVFQHAWPDPHEWAARSYDVGDHVLSGVARSLGAPGRAQVDERLTAQMTPQLLEEVLALVPDPWLEGTNAALAGALPDADADRWRRRYVEMLLARLALPSAPWREVVVG